MLTSHNAGAADKSLEEVERRRRRSWNCPSSPHPAKPSPAQQASTQPRHSLQHKTSAGSIIAMSKLFNWTFYPIAWRYCFVPRNIRGELDTAQHCARRRHGDGWLLFRWVDGDWNHTWWIISICPLCVWAERCEGGGGGAAFEGIQPLTPRRMAREWDSEQQTRPSSAHGAGMLPPANFIGVLRPATLHTAIASLVTAFRHSQQFICI